MRFDDAEEVPSLLQLFIYDRTKKEDPGFLSNPGPSGFWEPADRA
jgi:hypothetical protein